MIITVQDLINGIRKNGLPKATGYYFRDSDGTAIEASQRAVSACALGQASINLNLDPFELFYRARDVKLQGHRLAAHFGHDVNLGDLIAETNDNTDKSITEIADYLDEILTPEEKTTVLIRN